MKKNKNKKNFKDKQFYFEFYASNLHLMFTPQENPVIILLYTLQKRTSKKKYCTDVSYE